MRGLEKLTAKLKEGKYVLLVLLFGLLLLLLPRCSGSETEPEAAEVPAQLTALVCTISILVNHSSHTSNHKLMTN